MAEPAPENNANTPLWFGYGASHATSYGAFMQFHATCLVVWVWAMHATSLGIQTGI
jgi:hypothetical protein